MIQEDVGGTQTKRWELRPDIPAESDEAVVALARGLRCPVAVARLLVGRGIGDVAAAMHFFAPSVDDLLDPLLLLGMPEAVARIQRAVAGGEAILIYGDYDVDGTTAVALLKTAIERIAPKEMPAKVAYHVPHRILEGYGMQEKVLGAAALAGVRLVISVDTGIRAFAAAREASALGLDLIVTDHHLPDNVEGNPEAVAVVNPAQEGCGYPFKHLCGAAVAFKLAHALMTAAAETDAERERLKKVLVPSFLKLVAIATVADSVPLVGENRAIVALGLRELKNPVQAGLKALMQVAQIPAGKVPTAMEIGFRLGPRINAAGRMDVAGDVVELLLTRDAERAAVLAEKLNRLNEDRRATEAEALKAIEERLETMKTAEGEFPAECLILDDEGWHRGVLGILASRVVDRTGRPALVLMHEDGQAHGSGRSIEGFHLLDALTAVDGGDADDCVGVFSRFGGHAHAVGFSLPSGMVEVLRRRMTGYAGGRLTARMLEPGLECDLELGLKEITTDFVDWVERCGPFGMANQEPVFVSRGVVLCGPARVIKETHVCLELRREGVTPLKALGWSRGFDWAVRCSAMALGEGSIVDVAYRVRKCSYGPGAGIEVELELCDLQVQAQMHDRTVMRDRSESERKMS